MDWDFGLFVQRWPGSVTQDPLPKNITEFVMHGLWPERNDNSWPQFCSGSTFDPSKIASIKPNLLQHWPDLEKNNAPSFWSHEFDKHGTCACDGTMPIIKNELGFFTFALKMQSQINLTNVLAQANIVPDPSATYTVSDITNAISSALSAVIVISCKEDNGNYRLERVYVCIAKTGLVQDCPPQVVSGLQKEAKCGSGQAVAMPPIQH